ncbi:MAG: T9SS type A sorting domain-containing protein, partial [Flavobacteriales bacterium]
MTITDGGVYVLWYMNGPNVNIAEDIAPPFSLHTYEVLGGTWAEYRDREATDFHIGLQLVQEPVPDVGVSGFFGTAPGQNIVDPITVRTWITNYGTLPASGFTVSYQFADGAVVTAPYTGAAIAPGAQVLFSFPQLFDPDQTTTDALCAWSNWAVDQSDENDTTCVTVNAFVGIGEVEAPRLRLWPNPTSARLLADGVPPGPCTIAVLDASGRTVLEQRHTATQAPVELSLEGLPEGIYEIRIVSADQNLRASIIRVE